MVVVVVVVVVVVGMMMMMHSHDATGASPDVSAFLALSQ